MNNSNDFLAMIVDNMEQRVAILNPQGEIEFVNQSWMVFSRTDSRTNSRTNSESHDCLTVKDWVGVNYLKICQDAAASGDEFGRDASRGIEQVIKGEQAQFELEYPCHKQDEYRWFMMKVAKSMLGQSAYYMITHQDISSRKQAQAQALALAYIDGLTNIANRRRFDEMLDNEWRRCERLLLPLSLLMIDVDFFTLLNEDYSHEIGDDFLKALAVQLTKYTKRPGDVCARYDDDRFAVLFSNTYVQDASVFAEAIRTAVVELNVPNANAPETITTISMGLVTLVPQSPMTPCEFVKASCEQLSQAKSNGRNQLAWVDTATPEL